MDVFAFCYKRPDYIEGTACRKLGEVGEGGRGQNKFYICDMWYVRKETNIFVPSWEKLGEG